MPGIRWEYKSLQIDTSGFFGDGKIDPSVIDDQLASLGAEGWELVSVVPVETGGRGGTARLLYTLKRPVAQ